jgi:hypothetical protein
MKKEQATTSTAVAVQEKASVPALSGKPEFTPEEVAALKLATEVHITDQKTFEEAGKALLFVKQGRERIELFFAKAIKSANDTLDELKTMYAAVDKDWAAAHVRLQGDSKKNVVGLVVQYQLDQKEAERKAQELLDQQTELNAQVQAAADAIHAGDMGAPDSDVRAIMESPIYVPPVAPRTYVRPAGIGDVNFIYSAEIISMSEFLRYIIGVPISKKFAHPEYLGLLQAVGPSLNKIAEAQKDNFRLPGL